MTQRERLILFLVAAFCLLPALALLAVHLPQFGAHALIYGDTINTVAPIERHVTNMVSAVNFDYRGIDTLGEEFMMLCAVTGTVVLLRGNRGEQSDALPGVVNGRQIVERSDAVRAVSRLAAPFLVLFGIYIALHAMTTPGGGFQGGVIVATGMLLGFLGESYRMWRQVARTPILDVFEGGGATLYAFCGFASMVCGTRYLTNILPFGTLRDVFSGGLMLVENAGVAFAVTGGFAALFLEFLEETRTIRPDQAK